MPEDKFVYSLFALLIILYATLIIVCLHLKNHRLRKIDFLFYFNTDFLLWKGIQLEGHTQIRSEVRNSHIVHAQYKMDLHCLAFCDSF